MAPQHNTELHHWKRCVDLKLSVTQHKIFASTFSERKYIANLMVHERYAILAVDIRSNSI